MRNENELPVIYVFIFSFCSQWTSMVERYLYWKCWRDKFAISGRAGKPASLLCSARPGRSQSVGSRLPRIITWSILKYPICSLWKVCDWFKKSSLYQVFWLGIFFDTHYSKYHNSGVSRVNISLRVVVQDVIFSDHLA